MTLETSFFYFFSTIVVLGSIMVIGSPNPIHSVLFLILVFCNASALLILLEVEFLAMIFLVIYVGAIAVLFLFVVMMLNINLAELNEHILKYLPIGGIIGIIFLIEVFATISHDEVILTTTSIMQNTPTETITFAQHSDWVSNLAQLTNIEIFGLILYTHYSYLFIIASLILLVAMIGAIVLTVQNKREIKRQDIVDQLLREAKTAVVLWSPAKK